MSEAKTIVAVGAVFIAAALMAGYGTPATGRYHKPAAPPTAKPETSAFKPGQVFRDCPECPELAVVPAGIYIMGLNGKSKKSKPPHRVNIAKPFALGRFEVTFDQWQACVGDGGGCKREPDDHRWGRESRPVINVT